MKKLSIQRNTILRRLMKSLSIYHLIKKLLMSKFMLGLIPSMKNTTTTRFRVVSSSKEKILSVLTDTRLPIAALENSSLR